MAAFNILHRSLNASMGEPLALSVVATSVPGRIYAEVTSFANAMTLARSVPELDPTRVIPVPRDEIMSVLSTPSSGRRRQQWARVGRKKKWSWYAGDTGLIEMFEGSRKKYLALLPRLQLAQGVGSDSRPSQALVERAHLQAQVGVDAVKDELHDRYIWKGHVFSAEGLLLVDLDDIDILPILDTVPTSLEFDMFLTTSLLSSRTSAKTAHRMLQSRLKIGNRVKVMVGEYIGMVGKIVEIIGEIEVVVYLPSQDLNENMPKNSVRAMFCIGDQVEVVDGENLGLTGWVIGASPTSLHVVNME